MKTTEFPFPIRSQFLDPCTDSIRAGRSELLAGKTVRIQLSRKGYARQVNATIEPTNAKCFRIDREYEEGRLSARIRAAALALFNEQLFGRFELIHEDGLLSIRLIKQLRQRS
jgi:hypothetical protein